MIRISVNADSEILRQLARRMPGFFGGGVAPATQKAFGTSAKYIQRVWKGWAMGDTVEGIPNIKKPNGKLAASVQMKPAGPFSVSIFSESPYMNRIVHGSPELDMKETHPYGRKSRVSKKGIPYLIVPFRWGTPNREGQGRAHFANFIPVEMFNVVKSLKASKRKAVVNNEGEITGGQTHSEGNFWGEDIERSDYDWGGRHDGDGNTGGMVRMSGGGGYFTFRVISAKSPAGSWIRKEQPAVDIEGGLKKAVTPAVEEMVRMGLEADFGA